MSMGRHSEANGASLAESVFRTYHKLIVRLAASRVGASNADEVVSRVYEKLLLGKRPKPEVPLLPWLCRVVLNEATDLLRRTKESPRDLVPCPSGHDQLNAVLDRMEVDEALSRLTPAARAAMVLQGHGYSASEVAELLHTSPHAVHSLATRGRRRLKVELGRAVGLLLGACPALRRWVQETGRAAPAVAELAVMAAALSIASWAIPSAPNTQEPVAVGGFAASSFGGDARLRPLAADAQSKDEGVELDRADVAPAREQPAGLQLHTSHRDGSAAPDEIRVTQPGVDTPWGRAGGSSTRVRCLSKGFQVVPRNDDLYRLC